MWEYRASWTDAAPRWWDAAWTHTRQVLAASGRRAEERVDVYWIIDGRVDLAIKRRGGQTNGLDLKVRYERRPDGWELWEKTVFQRWTPLESVRCAALLQLEPDFSATTRNAIDGVQGLLRRAGFTWHEQPVTKARLQTTARAMHVTGAPFAERDCLAELAEFRRRSGDGPARSLCFEARAPLRIAPGDETADLVAGYPELLSR